MKQLVEYELEGGASIMVEVELPEAGIQRAGREDQPVKATRKFEAALEQVKPVAEKVLETLRGLANPPNEIDVQFGIKLSAKAGAIIASADTEANFTVTLTWKR